MWRVYYEDGTFDSTQGGPWESPVWGVVCIAQRTTEYDSVLCSGVPWYVFRIDWGLWQELDTIGFHDALLNNARNITAVRPGRYIKTDKFKVIWQQAREWARG